MEFTPFSHTNRLQLFCEESRITSTQLLNTFPADPGSDKKSADGLLEDRQPSVERPSPHIPQPGFQSSGEGRPARLSLQVPQHTGGPVRLATPPALQVNGEARELETRSDSDDPTRTFGPPLQHPQSGDMLFKIISDFFKKYITLCYALLCPSSFATRSHMVTPAPLLEVPVSRISNHNYNPGPK